jgi:hypothetical protein
MAIVHSTISESQMCSHPGPCPTPIEKSPPSALFVNAKTFECLPIALSPEERVGQKENKMQAKMPTFSMDPPIDVATIRRPARASVS